MKKFLIVLFTVIAMINCGGDSSETTTGSIVLTDTESVTVDTTALTVTYSGSDDSSSVTQNVTLSTSGSSGTTITWASDTPGTIAINGTVTRPVFGSGNATVVLTATIDKNGTNDTKQFTLTVIEAPQSDADVVAADKASLEITYGGTDSSGSVTQNVTLSTSGSSGSTITWASDITGVIANNGTVTRPVFGSGNATVVLTATIDKNGTNDTKQFTLTVIEAPQSDAEAVAADKASLEITYGGTDSSGSVTQNVTLSTSGSSGTTISWASDTPGTIATDGTVIRPSGTNDATVTLTATITKGIESDTKQFVLTVTDPTLFITTWKTTADGESITIPTTTGTYNYTVYWGDGNTDTGQTGNATHTYASAGTYTVKIGGTFPRIFFNGAAADMLNILTIEQWGNIAWTSMGNAFNGCSNLTYNATDAPDLSGVTDMSYMFVSASSFNGDLNSWDVSGITDMSYMFQNAVAFNGNISSWNVGLVENMTFMFAAAFAFNGDLSSWNVGSVTSMYAMFFQAAVFNGAIGSWDVSNITDMSFMFNNADTFNQSLTNWDVSSVTTMEAMFKDTNNFNGDISGWLATAGSSLNMSSMFKNADAFNQSLTGWNVSNVINMSFMFQDTALFNGDLTNWNVGNVTTMESMFENAAAFNGDMTGWLSSAGASLTMTAMFKNADAFNQSLTGWNVSSVTDMSFMFMDTALFNGDLTNWNVGSVTTMESMFQNAAAFNGDMTGWLSSAGSSLNMMAMFRNADAFNQNIDGWNVSNVTVMTAMFYGTALFNQSLNSWDVSNVTEMGAMFSVSTLFNGNISSWNVTGVSSMNNMFYFASAFTNHDLSGWTFTVTPTYANFGFTTGDGSGNTEPTW